MLKILVSLAAVGLVALVLLWRLQRRLIYLPLASSVPAVDAVLPGAEEVSFATADGLTLRAWFLPAEAHEAQGTVLVFHGNAGHRADRAPLAAALARRGFSVLLTDYRGYGGNPGSPSEDGLVEDARAARSWLDSRQGVAPERVIYYGESLGAAVAVALAESRPPAALVLRSPFTSMVDVARFHYPVLPVRLLLLDRFPSLDRVTRFDCAVLVVAGDRDRVVPFEQSRRVFEAAAGSPKRFVRLEGADHNDYEMLAGERLLEEIVRFWHEARGVAEGARP